MTFKVSFPFSKVMTSNFWYLPPTLGEIHEGKLCLIFSCPPNQQLKVAFTNINNPQEEDIVQWIESTRHITKIIFDDLEVDTIYYVRWYHHNQNIYSHNVNTHRHFTRYIFVSCDNPEADTRHSLWHTIEDEIRNHQSSNIQMIHLGDQVYMDACFNRAHNYFLTTQSHSNSRRKLVEPVINDMMKRYNQTWGNHPWVLSNCSHLMIWDDHEITNDYILSEDHSDVDTLVARYCINLYSIYQEGLHLKLPVNGPGRSWYKIHDQTLILAIERTTHFISFDEIFNLINLQGLTIENLILSFSAPVVPAPQGRLISRVVEPSKFWDIEDVKRLYRLVFNWLSLKCPSGHQRQALVIGGDLHFGYHGRVTRGSQGFDLVIASPITNHPSLDRKLYAQALRRRQNLDDMTLNCVSCKARRCYATLDIQNGNFRVSMTYNRETQPRSWRRYLKTLTQFAGWGVSSYSD